MSGIQDAAANLVHRIATSIGDLLPSPPPADPPPPISTVATTPGRADDVTAIEVEMKAKGGHGGTR